MCPAAEKLLGTLAERDATIVPIAFHVDYFNNPWKDIFSDRLYSQRQMNYNELYTKPKKSEYGLYYTPMMMIDGQQSVNGRDAASAEAAIRQALSRKPAVSLDIKLDQKSDGLEGTAEITVTSRSGAGRKDTAARSRRACAKTRSSPQLRRVKMPASHWSLAFRHDRRSTTSSSSTPNRPRSSDLPLRSNPAGTNRNFAWPSLSRTSRPVRSIRRPIYPGNRIGPPAARPSRRPRSRSVHDSRSPTRLVYSQRHRRP